MPTTIPRIFKLSRDKSGKKFRLDIPDEIACNLKKDDVFTCETSADGKVLTYKLKSDYND